MAVNQIGAARGDASARADSEIEPQRFDLRDDFGIDVPRGGSDVTVTVRGDAGGFVIDVERTHRWTVEGTRLGAELTAVYDEGRSLSLPERVPAWLTRVLDNLEGVTIDEVTV